MPARSFPFVHHFVRINDFVLGRATAGATGGCPFGAEADGAVHQVPSHAAHTTFLRRPQADCDTDEVA